MPENVNEQVAWNLSEILIGQIGNLLQKANTEFINGKIANAFVSMQTIRLLINQDLAPEEITALNSAELEAIKIMNSGSIYTGFTTNESKKKQYFLGRAIFVDYHNLIMGALKRHGYSIPPKPDSTRIN